MNTDTLNKIIIGTVLKADKEAKISGKLCMSELSLIKIIGRLRNTCCINITDEQILYLDDILSKLQNKSKTICKYRQTNFNKQNTLK